MRWCHVPRSFETCRLRRRFAALLALAPLAVWCTGARAQTAGRDGGDRFAVPTVEPEISGPLDGFRREIDPDAQRDPFEADRNAEDERDNRRRAERGRLLGGEPDTVRGDRPGEGLRGSDDPERDDEKRDLDRARREDDIVEDPREETLKEVAERSEEAAETLEGPYDPIGVRLGSFLLFPEITTEALHTDNALIATDNPESDWATVLTPSLTLKSTWSRHYLEGRFGATRSYYSRFDEANDETFNANLLGRLDVTRRTAIETTALYQRELEDINSVSAPTDAAERTPIITTGGTVQASHRFNRLTASLRGGITEYDYEDVTLAGGGVANNDDRDFTEHKTTARLSYDFRPGVAGFVEGSVNTRDFDSLIDDDGIRRGSDGYQAQAGLTLDLGGKLTGEIAAGYALQDPDEVAFDDISGFVFAAGLEWQATSLTTVNFDASTEIAETTLVDSPGSLVHSAELAFEHAFRRNLIAGISLGYVHEEYTGSGQVDKDYTLGLTGEYLLNRSIALVAGYDHTTSTSTAPGLDTVENEVRMGVRLRR